MKKISLEAVVLIEQEFLLSLYVSASSLIIAHGENLHLSENGYSKLLEITRNNIKKDRF